jgi:hypothetical protein
VSDIVDSTIPPEHFAAAISAYRADPEIDVIFRNAPYGAKLFLGLLFYKAYFNESADNAEIQRCLSDIEPSLKKVDIEYLLQCDIEEDNKAYLKGLRAARGFPEGEAAQKEICACSVPAPVPGGRSFRGWILPERRQGILPRPRIVCRQVIPHAGFLL